MTESIKGKVPLDAQVYLNEAELDNAQVYVHLKGYARATVTHLDIEHPELAWLIPPKTRTFIWIIGIENGILIRTEEDDTVKILQPLLNNVLQPGGKTKTCVGGKSDGIFIGFRRRELSKLEQLAETLFSEH
ncbi:MAG: hypothetical protein EFT35_02380 [Methanophagales archaeon ANME-1-THS]|nr:MAG: hypothetical protein EFT35_02380 [Methanophagales archaeon ANME-1-THS]